MGWVWLWVTCTEFIFLKKRGCFWYSSINLNNSYSCTERLNFSQPPVQTPHIDRVFHNQTDLYFTPKTTYREDMPQGASLGHRPSKVTTCATQTMSYLWAKWGRTWGDWFMTFVVMTSWVNKTIFSVEINCEIHLLSCKISHTNSHNVCI